MKPRVRKVDGCWQILTPCGWVTLDPWAVRMWLKTWQASQKDPQRDLFESR